MHQTYRKFRYHIQVIFTLYVVKVFKINSKALISYVCRAWTLTHDRNKGSHRTQNRRLKTDVRLSMDSHISSANITTSMRYIQEYAIVNVRNRNANLFNKVSGTGTTYFAAMDVIGIEMTLLILGQFTKHNTMNENGNKDSEKTERKTNIDFKQSILPCI